MLSILSPAGRDVATAAVAGGGEGLGALLDFAPGAMLWTWIAFLVASILFIQVPGPSLLFTIGRALTVGRREALLSVVGNGLGVTTQAFLVALGLGALALLTVPLFWTGLPAVLGTGGIVLGRMREDEPQGRRLAQAATRLGAASIVLYLLLVVVDLLG